MKIRGEPTADELKKIFEDGGHRSVLGYEADPPRHGLYRPCSDCGMSIWRNGSYDGTLPPCPIKELMMDTWQRMHEVNERLAADERDVVPYPNGKLAVTEYELMILIALGSKTIAEDVEAALRLVSPLRKVIQDIIDCQPNKCCSHCPERYGS
jgi:hypothetical protein